MSVLFWCSSDVCGPQSGVCLVCWSFVGWIFYFCILDDVLLNCHDSCISCAWRPHFKLASNVQWQEPEASPLNITWPSASSLMDNEKWWTTVDATPVLFYRKHRSELCCELKSHFHSSSFRYLNCTAASVSPVNQSGNILGRYWSLIRSDTMWLKSGSDWALWFPASVCKMNNQSGLSRPWAAAEAPGGFH